MSLTFRTDIFRGVRPTEVFVPIERLPERWASALPIRLMWNATATGSDLATVESRLRDFNNRLYDCTDGQWRIGCFLIQDNQSRLDPEGKGVGHIHRTDTHGPHGHADGRPDDPKHWHVNETSRVGAYLMEFLHSWTGLKDEYEVSQGGARTNCPASVATRDSTNACVMDDTYGTPTELCRPGTHNPNTEQGNVRGMDCYSWLKKVMDESGHPGFQVPANHIPGPATAPTLRFVYLTIQRVRQIEDPDPGLFQGSADYYARARIGGQWLARTRTRDDTSQFSPNWLFGFAFSNNSHQTIPIRIELWDEDGVFNGNDLCDISPVAGKKGLEIRYNTATGQITGDVTGMRDSSITVRGTGDSDKAEITFMITSR